MKLRIKNVRNFDKDLLDKIYDFLRKCLLNKENHVKIRFELSK